MSQPAIFFLTFIAPLLVLLLAGLGAASLRTNFLGWFLVLVGVVYSAGIVIQYWIRGRRSFAPEAGGAVVQEERGDRSFWAIAVGMAGAFYASPVETIFFPALLPRIAWMKAAGMILVLSGAAIFIWARRTMKAVYSGHVSITETQPLVQSGPYHVIRHPAYAGFFLMALGISLGYASIAGLASLIFLLIPGLTWRIRVEERLLEQHFTTQWQDYCRRVPAFFPKLKP